MTFRYDPISGRAVFTDPSAAGNPIVFDTNDGFLCVAPTDVKIGSKVVPARTASSSGVDGVQRFIDENIDYEIASVTPGARVVRGLMRTTWASNPEPLDNLWRAAGGSHLDIYDAIGLTFRPQTDLVGNMMIASLGFYSFYVNTTTWKLMMNERLVVRARDSGGPPTQYNRARQQCTVSYRLLVGFFM